MENGLPPGDEHRLDVKDREPAKELPGGQPLLAALDSGSLGGAALDVFEREPTVNEELFGLPNVVLLPHMGSATIEGRTEMGEKVIINIKTFADGHRPPDRVIPSIL